MAELMIKLQATNQAAWQKLGLAVKTVYCNKTEHGMSVIVKGIYENGQVLLTEPAPTDKKVPVSIVFPQDTTENKEKRLKKNEIRFGSLAGRISVPDDFNDELDDFKEFMLQ
jgi:hypothetical protein